MIEVQVQIYLGRARDFFDGMRLLKEDLTAYKSSSALLGIHCAISYSDAIRIGMGCVDLSSEDHLRAVNDLKSRLASKRLDDMRGASNLKKLLSVKSWIEYSDEAARENEIEDIVKWAERFASWAERTGKQLRIEGWGDGNH